MEDLTFDEWKQQINININGYFLTSQRFGRQMIKQKKGTMVHISTVASHFPETYSGAYSTTKAAVNMISKQIAAEWGQFGVRSNCVLPCLVKTPLSKDFYKDKEVEDYFNNEVVNYQNKFNYSINDLLDPNNELKSIHEIYEKWYGKLIKK